MIENEYDELTKVKVSKVDKKIKGKVKDDIIAITSERVTFGKN